jgi:hypothetical protein
VIKPTIDVYAEPKFESPKVATLKRDAAVTVTAQQGLWYALKLAQSATGYVRVNDVRINYGKVEDGDANLRALSSGKAGVGRVTETAGVRGIDESDLKSASFNQAQLDAMVANRVDANAAAAHAGEQHWEATTVAYDAEAKSHKNGGKKGANSSSSGGEATNALKGVLGSFSSGLSSALGTADKVAPKPEAEQAAEELALGPQIAGRILGARPLWNDAGAQKACERHRPLGRIPDQPTGTAVDVRRHRHPRDQRVCRARGYVLVTRGMYEILSTDGEVAAVLGHEISHCVPARPLQRDPQAGDGGDREGSRHERGQDRNRHRECLRTGVRGKARRSHHADGPRSRSRVSCRRSGGGLRRAGGHEPGLAVRRIAENDAAGTQSASLAQLYKTHPPLDERMNHIDRRDYKSLKAYTTRE